MTLFQILTRYVAAGKIKVTRKLLKRLRGEGSRKRCSKPSKPSRRKNSSTRRSCCAALMAVWTLSVCLVTVQAAASQSSRSVTAASSYSAPALFNQANAYARDGKTGLAILNYERAKLLAPNDADIGANLHFVRTKASLPDAPENRLIRSLTYARPNTMAWLGSFGLLLAGLGIVFARLDSRRRLAFRSLTCAGGLLVASAIGNAVATWPKMTEAVITAHDVPAFASPVSAAESMFKLREGEIVTLRAMHHDFALVRNTAGRAGWVSLADLTRVVPQSGNPAPSPDRT